MTLEEIGVMVRHEDVSLRERLRELCRMVNGRVLLSAEIRVLRDDVFENFEDGVIWMYRVLRMRVITGDNVPSEWMRAKEVMEHFMRIIERAVI
jgi:hypothetical protein